MTVEQILTKLVSFSVLGGDSNLSIANWIKDYIESFGVEVHTMYNEDKTKVALHCRIGTAVNGGVILSGHTDVVPVEGQDWHTNPFEVVDKGDGKLYGRGTSDMKGFVACCLASIPKFLKADLKKPIYIALSYDEEIGCLSGDLLAEEIKIHYTETPKYAIIGEASSLEPIVGQKGICILETHINGSAGHSSRIKQEVSAIHEAARLVLWLEDKMNSLINAGRLDQRFNPPHSSLHVGEIKGGIAANVIADKARFLWDVRTIPSDSMQNIIDEFIAHCKDVETKLKKIFPDCSINTIENHPPVPHLDTTEDQDIVKLIGKITGNTKCNTVAYASEAGQFANAGFDSIICGPGNIAQAHRPNEYISKEQLYKCMDMMHKLTTELSRENFK